MGLCPDGAGIVYPEKKRPGGEVDRSLPLVRRSRMLEIIPPLPPHASTTF